MVKAINKEKNEELINLKAEKGEDPSLLESEMIKYNTKKAMKADKQKIK